MGMENSRTFIRQDTLRDAIIYEIIDWEWNMMILWKQKTGKAPGEEEFEELLAHLLETWGQEPEAKNVRIEREYEMITGTGPDA